MKDSLSGFTLRVPQILLDKMGYIAKREGRSKNKEIEQAIKRRIAKYEEIHGEIDITDRKPDR